MGFFSNLMGQKLIGTLKIKFYGEDKASVEYETDALDKEQRESDLIQLFALYYAKMLFNLNRGQGADQLIIYIQKAVESVVSDKGIRRESLLVSEQKLVKPKNNDITKNYSGEFYEKSDNERMVQIKMDLVGEDYYMPISTVMFLQFLVNNLSESTLMFLVLTIGGMNKYYRETGEY